jgi:DNA invertase Pin-like site-specific DNA recombinase
MPARKFKIVVVWALDRFTREGIEATFNYIRQLKDGGVDFVSYTEAHFRTTGPAGSLMLTVAAWMAEQERKNEGRTGNCAAQG